jgi:HEAT repeat protein
MSILTSNKNRLFLAIYGLYFLVLVSVSSTAQGMDPVTNVQRMFLKQDGYSTDTPEQLIEATKSKSYYIRYAALNLLTEQIGKDAIPVLKQSLNDPHITVRWHTAHLLGTLGDKSGLGQMQKDFEELSAKGIAPLPTDPNMSPDMRERIENERKIALYDALEVAKVLAELGDRQGYKLATKAATESTWEPHKDKAIYVLAEIAKADPNILSAEGKDPISVLCAMAESEKSPYVFSKIIYSAAKLPYNEAVRILDKAKISPNQSQEKRNEAQEFINWLKAQKKVAGIQAKDPNSCCGQ